MLLKPGALQALPGRASPPNTDPGNMSGIRPVCTPPRGQAKPDFVSHSGSISSYVIESKQTASAAQTIAQLRHTSMRYEEQARPVTPGRCGGLGREHSGEGLSTASVQPKEKAAPVGAAFQLVDQLYVLALHAMPPKAAAACNALSRRRRARPGAPASRARCCPGSRCLPPAFRPARVRGTAWPSWRSRRPA